MQGPAHAPVGLELQTSEGEGQSGIDAKASIKAASLVGPSEVDCQERLSFRFGIRSIMEWAA